MTSSGAVHAAEVWDPATGEWSTWASAAVSRVYHSTTMLLPDGRLLHAGGGDGANLPRELSAELFTPPYLLRGCAPRDHERAVERGLRRGLSGRARPTRAR